MKREKNKTEGKFGDDLRPEYKIDYSKTWPNPYAGRVKLTHGGPRKGAGRKPRFGRPMTRKTIRLTEEEIGRLMQLGGGNLSEGIRAALRNAASHR